MATEPNRQSHVVRVFRNTSSVLSTNSIYTNGIGECSGIELKTPDGKSESMGFCVRTDKDANI